MIDVVVVNTFALRLEIDQYICSLNNINAHKSIARILPIKVQTILFPQYCSGPHQIVQTEK